MGVLLGGTLGLGGIPLDSQEWYVYKPNIVDHSVVDLVECNVPDLYLIIYNNLFLYFQCP